MSTIISLCDHSGVMVQPWAKAGCECIIVDILHEPGISGDGPLWRIGADILKWLPPRRDYVAGFAFTPCTNLSVSGARWFRDKGLRGLIEGLELFERARELFEWLGIPYSLENPVSTLSTYYRKPDHCFDPCDYAGYLEDPSAEAYTKRTCLWLGGGMRAPEPKRVEPTLGSKMHLLPPSQDRAAIRSKTPAGFARAMFEANKHLLLAPAQPVNDNESGGKG